MLGAVELVTQARLGKPGTTLQGFWGKEGCLGAAELLHTHTHTHVSCLNWQDVNVLQNTGRDIGVCYQ